MGSTDGTRRGLPSEALNSWPRSKRSGQGLARRCGRRDRLDFSLGTIDTVFVGHIWATSAKTAQSGESRKSCKSPLLDTCLVPANSGKKLDGKEGVAGSSPAEGSRQSPRRGPFVLSG